MNYSSENTGDPCVQDLNERLHGCSILNSHKGTFDHLTSWGSIRGLLVQSVQNTLVFAELLLIVSIIGFGVLAVTALTQLSPLLGSVS